MSSSSSGTKNPCKDKQYQSNGPMNHIHEQHRRRRSASSNSSKFTTTTRNTSRASQSSRLDSLSYKAAFHGSITSSDQLSTARVSGSQYQYGDSMCKTMQRYQKVTWPFSQHKTNSSSTSKFSRRFDDLSTMAVCNGSLQYPPPRSSRFDGLSTKAVHGSKWGHIKPIRLLRLRHQQTSKPSLFDGLSTKAVLGSRSSNIMPQVKLLQQHRKSQIQSSLLDCLSTKAVLGSRSGRFASYI